jgi:hypothetical protein
MAQNNADALAELAASLGIQLSFDGDNVCELLIDDETVVALTGDPEGADLRIMSIVGDLEDPEDPAALRLLLQANFNGQGVGDASLGMDHVSQEIVLTQSVAVGGLGDQGLNGTLEKFVHYLTFWKQNLTNLAAEGVGDLSDAVPGGMRV